MSPILFIYVIVAALVAAVGLVVAFRGDDDYSDAEWNALRVVTPLLVGACWPLFLPIAISIAIGWMVGAAIRAFHFRKERIMDREADASDLKALKEALKGHDAWVFGSSVKALPGGFSTRRGFGVHDVDLAIVVPQAAFVAWTAAAYDGGIVDNYNAVHPTRVGRRRAAEDVLGVQFPEYIDVDIFLFSEEYVNGSRSVPAWDGRFRLEVLSARKRLSSLGMAWAIPSALLYKAKR